MNPNGDRFDSNTLLFTQLSKVLSQSQLGSLHDSVAVAFAIGEVIDQVYRLLPLVSLLKRE